MAESVSGGKIDPGNYRRLSEPFPSFADAEAAVNGFWDELYELRNKWRIADIVMAMSVPLVENGAETKIVMILSAGSSAERLPLVAQAFGQIKEEHDELLRLCLSPPKSRRKSKSEK